MQRLIFAYSQVIITASSYVRDHIRQDETRVSPQIAFALRQANADRLHSISCAATWNSFRISRVEGAAL